MNLKTFDSFNLAPPNLVLQLYLLGPPEVCWKGESLVIPRRQTRALLYVLASQTRPISRQQLTSLFWSDFPEREARRNLTRLLTHLRRSLPGSDFILYHDEQVSLDPKGVWADIRAFHHIYSNRTNPAILPFLEEAPSLYRHTFLEGFYLANNPDFDQWLAFQQQVCERMYLEMLAILIEKHAQSDLDKAIHYAQQYLRTDELAEDIHRRLIELFVAAGNRPAALQQFERCSRVLERELNMEPLPETQAVYQAIRSGRYAAGPYAPARKVLPGWEAPFTGRGAAIHHLKELFRQVSHGYGQIVLVSGEPGIGKTRLVQEFMRSLNGQALLLQGGNQPSNQTMPYHSILLALRPALETYPALFRQTPRHWLVEASQLLPELGSLAGQLPAPQSSNPEQNRERLFQALSQLLWTAGSGPQPVLLFLDDLHWADSLTLDWVVYLAQQMTGLNSGRCRLMLVGTYSEGENIQVEALQRRLFRLGMRVQIKLPLLSEGDILDILHPLLGPRPEVPALACCLKQSTAGNPFFLLETLRALLESGQPLESLPNLPFPDSLRYALDERLSRLTPAARQILETASILEGSFDFDLVQQITGRNDQEMIKALEELVERRLLVEEEDRFWFKHTCLQNAVYQKLSCWRRKLLHRRAAEALQRLSSFNGPALARHFELAGLSGQVASYEIQTGWAV